MIQKSKTVMTIQLSLGYFVIRLFWHKSSFLESGDSKLGAWLTD